MSVASQNGLTLQSQQPFTLTKPASFGISTGWMAGKPVYGFSSLTDNKNIPHGKTSQDIINSELKELVELLQKYKYTEIAYSANEAATRANPQPILGTSVFNVGDDVRNYIVCRLIELKNNWSSISGDTTWPLDKSRCSPIADAGAATAVATTASLSPAEEKAAATGAATKLKGGSPQSTTKLKSSYNFIIDPKTKKRIKSNSKRGEAIIMGYIRNADSFFF